MQKYLILDYETFSECDIKSAGAFEYGRHPSTEILCASWRLGTIQDLRKKRVRKWSPLLEPEECDSPKQLADAIADREVILVAHNAFFERVITSFVFWKTVNVIQKLIPIERWYCTAAQAAALALPRKLADACAAIGAKFQKDMEGHRLMMKMSKPRKPTKNNPAKRHLEKKDILRLMDYCAVDVEAETELFLSTPMLPQSEMEVWRLDQKINWRGFTCDRTLVKKILKMIGEETKRLDEETEEISCGELKSTREVKNLKAFLASEGIDLPNMQAKTIQDTLNDASLKPGIARRLLEIRQAVSKTSTAKYVGFEARSRSDGKIRDHLVYHGASTGRWGGRGVQPHNFPQGRSVEDPIGAIDILKTGDLDYVKLFFKNPMDVFSACLRPMIKAADGKILFDADFSQIEARIVCWLAGQMDAIEQFRDNKPIYEIMATKIYGRLITKLDGLERDVGKRAVLGCGFGMGWKKFQETCAKYGQPVSDDLAKRAVKAYRNTYHKVPELWGAYEAAAIRAVRTGKQIKTNKVTWRMDGKFLRAVLPSGRSLWFYDPKIKYKKTPWGEIRPVLYHWDVHPITKKWVFTGTYGGKLTENIVQACARDLMVGAMIRAEKAGFEVLMSIHDENLSEKEDGDLEHYFKLIEKVPPWATGLPVKVGGWAGERYRK